MRTCPRAINHWNCEFAKSEELVAELESTLPIFHAHQAALQSYRDARSRASTAADRLKEARQRWSATLQRLGLSETMSPSSVRSLSDGYETLLAESPSIGRIAERTRTTLT